MLSRILIVLYPALVFAQTLVAHRETRTLSALNLVPGRKPFRQAASSETRPCMMSSGGEVIDSIDRKPTEN